MKNDTLYNLAQGIIMKKLRLYSIYLNICFLVFYYFFTLYCNFLYMLQIRKELPVVFGK